MAVLVIGGGSAGRRHARIAANLGFGPVTLVSKSAPELFADQVVRSLDCVDFRSGFQFAVIASPASEHIKHLGYLAKTGIPALVEKPISNDLEGSSKLLIDVDASAKIRVGYNLRFDQGFLILQDLVRQELLGRPLRIIAHAGQDLRKWRLGRDYRETVSARRELGGGVLLELSHEIDFLIRLAGSPASVSGRSDKIGDLDIDVEDSADLDIAFESGLRASLHLNMVQFPFRRTCEVICAEGTMVWDLNSRYVRYYSKDDRNWTVAWDGDEEGFEDSYEAQMSAFSHFVDLLPENNSDAIASSLATVSDALDVLSVIDACRRSSKDGRREVSVTVSHRE